MAMSRSRAGNLPASVRVKASDSGATHRSHHMSAPSASAPVGTARGRAVPQRMYRWFITAGDVRGPPHGDAVRMLLAVIVGCEIGFWAVLGAGLTARYLLRLRRLGA